MNFDVKVSNEVKDVKLIESTKTREFLSEVYDSFFNASHVEIEYPKEDFITSMLGKTFKVYTDEHGTSQVLFEMTFEMESDDEYNEKALRVRTEVNLENLLENGII